MTSAPLRIARVAERLPPCPGGKEIHVAELSTRQAARGHDVHVWHRSGESGLKGVSVHRVGAGDPDRRHGVATVADFSARAARGLTAVRPDLVHLHGDWVEALCVGRAARRLGVPTVLTVHAGLAPLWRLPSRVAFRYVDSMVAVGANVRDDLVRAGVPAERVTVLSSGLNTDLLAPHRGTPRSPRRIVSVGALEVRKGHDVLLEAFRTLRRTVPDAELVLVGSGRDEEALRALADTVGGVRFAGQLDRDAVYGEVASATVFVLASRPTRGTDEGTPTALLEALALGTPVVATRAGATASVVQDGENGLLVEPDDAAALADRLLTVLGGLPLQQRLAAAGPASVQGRDWESVVDGIDRVYAALVSRSAEPA